MNKIIISFLVLMIAAGGCTTKVYPTKPLDLSGQKIAIGIIAVEREKDNKNIYNDTVCACIAKAVGETLVSYLQQTGAVIVPILNEHKTSMNRIYAIADSLQVNYVVSGTGALSRTGKTDFMRRLTIKLVSVKTKEILLSGSFSGPSVYPEGAAERIGKRILSRVK